MTKPRITITIDGPAGAGKSTLAEHLAAHLAQKHGVKVTLNDDGMRQRVNLAHVELAEHFNAEVDIIVEQK